MKDLPGTPGYATPEEHPGRGEHIAAVAGRRYSRRDALKGGAALVAGALAAPLAHGAAPVRGAEPLNFRSLPTSTTDALTVAAGHGWAPLLRWGDPVLADAPVFNPAAQSPEAQKRQFGYNNDFMAYLPLPYGSGNPSRGLLWVNHEYTNPELMFAGFDASNVTRDQVDIQLEAHGGTVVEIRRGDEGRWSVVQGSPYNRRITGTTPMDLTGPVAGSDWAKTGANPEGRTVVGMLNNCAGGWTPWGTVLTCEENFPGYFGNLNRLPENDPRRVANTRYGVTPGASRYQFERRHSRYDCAVEPNEPGRFGYVVEVDPYNPTSQPRKHTALGRLLHEGATTRVSPSGKVTVYTGDDARFEYAYKFVTEGTYNPGNREANMSLLESGTLYVATFNDDGSGQWLPLVYGQGPLTAANAFYSQADVLVQARRAADLLGATKMDRPEDFEPNPVTGKVYLVMTFNEQRGAAGRAPVDRANPVAENVHGHIIELTEAGNDAAATAFTWGMFLVCGDPATNPYTYYAGFPKNQVSSIAAPDNLCFDVDGNLWIFTDGQIRKESLAVNDSVYVAPTEGPDRGHLRRLLNGVPGGECASGILNSDSTALFVSIQHPGEGGTVELPVSTFPDGGIPRPSVVQVWNSAGPGARIGVVGPAAAGRAPAALPRTGDTLTGIAGAGMAAGLAAAAVGGLLRLRTRRSERTA